MRLRLWPYLVAGLAGGAAYAGLNTAFDLWDNQHLLALHTLFDRVLPLCIGALGGLAVHGLRLRTHVAHEEAARAGARANELRARLEHVERDQAVWVVATATLHEVKNPLHALGLLLEEVAEELPADAPTAPLVERARAQARRIDDTLGGLRDLAGAAGPRVRAVALAPLVAEVAESARRLGGPARIDVKVDADAAAAVDPAWVRIIVENLVGNGIEGLGARGGHLAIEVERRDEGACVRVSDDGPGLPPEVAAAPFAPFGTTKAHGLGLGLPVARALARAMRGDLAQVERPGWSTTFELTLPAGPS